MQDEQAIVSLHKGGFKVLPPSQISEMIEHANMFQL